MDRSGDIRGLYDCLGRKDTRKKSSRIVRISLTSSESISRRTQLDSSQHESKNRTATIWDIAARESVLTPLHEDWVIAAKYSP